MWKIINDYFYQNLFSPRKNFFFQKQYNNIMKKKTQDVYIPLVKKIIQNLAFEKTHIYGFNSFFVVNGYMYFSVFRMIY